MGETGTPHCGFQVKWPCIKSGWIIKLNREHAELFKKTIFSDLSPIPLLSDIELLLSEVGEAGLPVSPKTKCIAMGQLERINASLSMPLQIAQTRPLQESFPNINGLYFLLRASGLARIRKKGANCFLVANERVVEAWHGLNQEEKYVSLLKYFLYASHGLVARFGSMNHYPLAKLISFFNAVGPSYTRVKGDKKREQSLTYRYGTYFVVLLHLFQLVDITHAKIEKGEKWFPEKIRRTQLGDVLVGEAVKTIVAMGGEGESEVDTVLAHCFPNVKKRLCEGEAQSPGFHDGLYLFKVALQKFSCRIALPGRATFATFASSILDAVGFDDEHQYSFEFENDMGVDVRIVDDAAPEYNTFFCEDATVGSVSLNEGAEMQFLYDFGDCWTFSVELESISEPDEQMKHPKITGRKGTPPVQYPYDDDDDWF